MLEKIKRIPTHRQETCDTALVAQTANQSSSRHVVPEGRSGAGGRVCLCNETMNA